LTEYFTNRLHLWHQVSNYYLAAVYLPEVLVVDIWDSAEDFTRFGEIMLPIAKKNGVEAEAEIYPLYNELH
jgi:hypothetical protein